MSVQPTGRETRNLKFMSAGDGMKCGGSGACSLSAGALWCRNGDFLADNPLGACPAEYNDGGAEWSNTCLNPHIVAPRLRKCNKKSVTDPVFNILETEYKANKNNRTIDSQA